MVQSRREQKLEAAHELARTLRPGIEDPQLDVRMGIERGESLLDAVGIHVIDENPHAHAAIGRRHQAIDEESPVSSLSKM